MWKPPQRVKYKASPGGGWPSQQEASSAQLFKPLSFQALRLNERTWVPAMVPWRAEDDGAVTADNLDWYGRFARGQPGAIVVEATGIRDIPSGPLLRIGHDRYVPGLEQIVQRVREESKGYSKLFIQLIDFLSVKRRPAIEAYFGRFLKVRPEHAQAVGLDEAADEAEVRAHLMSLDGDELEAILTCRELESLRYGYRERVTDMELEHIRDLPKQLPELFAAAAVRAKKAGFDGVELHYAHAYTMASFLSRTNTRDDGYGRTLEGRQRLALEVMEAVLSAVGRDFVVGARILADECIDGGSDLTDATAHAVALCGAGLDFLSLSRGGKFDDAKQPKVGEAVYPYTGVSGYECMPGYISDEQGPFGRNIPLAKHIRMALRNHNLLTPVIVAGGIHNFDQAEGVLAEGLGDIVGLARQALADPDWFIKVRTGQGNAVNLCEYTNYCEGLDQKHKQVTCQLWDRDFSDGNPSRTSDGKRRLVAPDWRPIHIQK